MLFRERLRLGMVLTMPSTTKNETQTANSADGERRPRATGLPTRFWAEFWTGFWTERVTFRRPQIMKEGRANTASNGLLDREKACGTWPGTRAGSLPAAPNARRPATSP